MSADVLPDLMERLGWALVYFLWQGALIAALLAAVLRMLRTAAPNRRYLAGCAALVLCSCAPLVTICSLTPPQRQPAVAITKPIEPTNAVNANSGTATKWFAEWKPAAKRFDFVERTEEFLPWVVVGWAVGVAALSCRLAAGWLLVNRLRRAAATALDAHWQARLAELKRRLGIARPVRLLQSALLEVPTVIGWLKPVILLPASCVARLSPAQLESILAHELAHIRRHDYLVNVLQSVVETLLFYHPAVWWVSRRVREERELCCDDLAVEVCGDRAAYARALATLEEMRAPTGFALAASGTVLLPRIRRLAGKSDGAVNRAAWPIAGIIVLVLLAILALEWRRHDRVVSPPVVSLRVVSPRMVSQRVVLPPRPKPMSIKTFMVDPSKFPLPLSQKLEDVRQFSYHIVMQPFMPSQGSRQTVTQPSPGMWTVIWNNSHTASSLNPSSVSNPNEPGKTVQTEMLKFFSGMGVDFDASDPANAGKEINYIRLTRGGMLMVRALADDLSKIENALKQMDAIAKPYSPGMPPTNHAAHPLTAPALMIPPPPQTRPVRAPDSASAPPEVTAAILEAQRQTTAATQRPFPPVPPPPETSESTHALAPQTGLRVPRGPTLETRTFRVNPQLFIQQLETSYGLPPGSAFAQRPKDDEGRPVGPLPIQVLMREFFVDSGADFSTNNPANAAKVFAYGDRGLLMVRATPDDLNLITQALEKWNPTTPEVNLKVVFFELGGTFDPLTGPDGIWKKKLRDVTTDNTSMGKPDAEIVTNGISVVNPSTEVTIGILPKGELKLMINKLERRNDVDALNAPEVTTESGRQAQIQAVDITNVMTGVLDPAANESVTGTNRYQTLPLPIGPVVDLLPEVLKGSDDIKLSVIPSVTEFLGYDTAATNNSPPLPHFRVRQFITQRTIHDGETIVLLGTPKHLKKNLLVFVTATLINPDGTLYHPDPK